MSEFAEKSEVYDGRSSAIRNSPWLAASDLDGLGDVKVSIEACYCHKNPIQDPSKSRGRPAKQCFGLKFKGKDRQLWMNQSHRRALEAMFGKSAKDWQGKEVILYVEHGIKAFGELVDGIRIRVVRDKPKHESPQETQQPTVEQPVDESIVTMQELNQLKKDWRAVRATDVPADTSKETLMAIFAAWVQSVTGREFDVLEVGQWTRDDMTKCEHRICPPPEEPVVEKVEQS